MVAAHYQDKVDLLMITATCARPFGDNTDVVELGPAGSVRRRRRGQVRTHDLVHPERRTSIDRARRPVGIEQTARVESP